MRPFRIDLINEIPAVSFDEAWRSRIIVAIDDLTVPFIGKEAVIRNKRAAGRPQDLLDADLLESL